MPLLLVIAAVVAWLYLRGKGQAATLSGADAQRGGNLGVAAVGQAGSIPATSANLDAFAQAIYQFEGGNPGNRNVVNNNPGNLKGAPGATGTADGYATFANFGDGWSALQGYIQKQAAMHPGWDFYDFFSHYLGGNPALGPAPANQGDSDAYAEYVANQSGVSPSMPVSSFLGMS